MRRFLLILPLLALLITVRPLPTQAAEFRTDQNNVTISQPITRDTFALSNNVTITAPITGEAYLAGNTVSLTRPLSRSAYIVGNTITVSKGAGYDLYAAGQTATVGGTYGNDVYIAATNVTIQKGTVINGDLWIEGGDVTLAGTVKGSVHLDVDSLTSNAAIGGDVSGNVGTLTFTGGSIGGSLRYASSTDAAGYNTVKVSGQTSRTTPATTSQNAWNIVKDMLTAMVAMLLLGSLLALRFPATVSNLIDDISASYFRYMLYGLVSIIVVPIICFALAVTLIGWKVALFVLLAFALMLLIAGAIGMFLIGSWIYRRFVPHHRDNIWDYLITGILIAYILSAIPYVSIASSAIVGIAVFLPSLGGLVALALGRE